MTYFKSVATLSFVASLAAASSVFAQADAAAETEEASPNSIESQLSLGEDPNAGPQIGETYAKEVIGDWQLNCVKSEQDEDPCQMYQLIDDGDGTPVAEFSLFRLPGSGQAKAGATLVVPLETSLPQQVTITVDGGSARRYPYAFCNQIGCYARIGFTDNDVNSFKRGNAALITIVPALAQDQKVELDLSLTGFTAAFEEVSTVQQ